MSVNVKCRFARLKYEQLLAEKYFVESCFSRVYESYSPKQDLIDTLFEITSEEDFLCSTTTEVLEDPKCRVFTDEFSNEFE